MDTGTQMLQTLLVLLHNNLSYIKAPWQMQWKRLQEAARGLVPWKAATVSYAQPHLKCHQLKVTQEALLSGGFG